MAIHKQSKHCVLCGALITPEEREKQNYPGCFKCRPPKKKQDGVISGTVFEGIVDENWVTLVPVGTLEPGFNEDGSLAEISLIRSKE